MKNANPILPVRADYGSGARAGAIVIVDAEGDVVLEFNSLFWLDCEYVKTVVTLLNFGSVES